MSAFATVAQQLDAKYGGMNTRPWSLFGIADAPSLRHAISNQNSVAYSFFQSSKAWKARQKTIDEADARKRGRAKSIVDGNRDSETEFKTVKAIQMNKDFERTHDTDISTE